MIEMYNMLNIDFNEIFTTVRLIEQTVLIEYAKYAFFFYKENEKFIGT